MFIYQQKPKYGQFNTFSLKRYRQVHKSVYFIDYQMNFEQGVLPIKIESTVKIKHKILPSVYK